ncbi:hypothetical protein SAMN05216344_106139 [Polaromonas sp. OV174]|uniref:hypothetical protein n=1 Tax=Polaromonas sp. OV174 TaxID=1855300 RepID=UPI0008E5B914|nr:hypothetical protein [Polaromonas sp. OV174]SFB97020.1 hypothetical protein SAMN05216344_106139 [Polaromonas sp. OV174]
MSWPLQLVLALAIFAAGGAAGIKYHVGVDAQRELAAKDLRESDARQQRQFNDTAAGKHATAVATISNQLGNAREKIAQLSGRSCLDAGTVGMLNAIGRESMRAAAREPAGTAQAAATDRDVSTAIATCRAGYGEIESQLNQILDIEDRRHPPAP